MTALTLTLPRLRATSSLRDRFTAAVRALLAWRERARGRQQLAGLDDHLLRDIGIDRASAAYEADKRFWQP